MTKEIDLTSALQSHGIEVLETDIGTNFAEEKYLGGKGLAYKSLSENKVNKKLEFCLTCGKCKKIARFQ